MTFEQSSDLLSVLTTIVTMKLGAKLVSATEIEGGFGGGSIYRARVRMGRPSLEQEIIVKLAPVQGTSIIADNARDDAIFCQH